MPRALVSVGGEALPEPSAYSANTSSLVDSDRNVRGKFIGAVIRDNVAEIEMTWNYLTVQQWADINRKFKESDGGQFVNSVTFLDQSAGDWITRQMYISDRKAGLWQRDARTGDIQGWTNCKLSLTEV
ncbi:hypothetical protein [Feifania hominis]|uniref:Uncharacterized protein n=1 Tax=Feifania hominis TaxID=2763660 RepID=A0A926DEY2_9FIRM|nr:hypothetical protein [Feifania hominis]MBC8536893.1 hypothetical protein [Feifania hominis]